MIWYASCGSQEIKFDDYTNWELRLECKKRFILLINLSRKFYSGDQMNKMSMAYDVSLLRIHWFVDDCEMIKLNTIVRMWQSELMR